MSTYSYYDQTTGAISPVNVTTSDLDNAEEFLALNAPANCLPIQGSYSPAVHRVDVASGKVLSIR